MYIAPARAVSLSADAAVLCPLRPDNESPLPSSSLVCTRYCHCHYCMVYCIHKGGRVGVVCCALGVQ